MRLFEHGGNPRQLINNYSSIQSKQDLFIGIQLAILDYWQFTTFILRFRFLTKTALRQVVHRDEFHFVPLLPESAGFFVGQSFALLRMTKLVYFINNYSNIVYIYLKFLPLSFFTERSKFITYICYRMKIFRLLCVRFDFVTESADVDS